MTQLVMFSGIAGTGKSSLASELGRELQFCVFSIDLARAFLIKRFVAQEWASMRAIGYELLAELADSQLNLQHSVIVDGVFARQEFRNLIIDVANRRGAGLKAIECICSDEELHKQRVLARRRDNDLQGVDWDYVVRIQVPVFETWQMQRLVLDSADAFDKNRLAAKAYIAA